MVAGASSNCCVVGAGWSNVSVYSSPSWTDWPSSSWSCGLQVVVELSSPSTLAGTANTGGFPFSPRIWTRAVNRRSSRLARVSDRGATG